MNRKRARQRSERFKKERFKKKWLEWALNLPTIRLNKLDVGEFPRLKSEAIFFCSSQFRFEKEESYFKALRGKAGLQYYNKMEGKIDLAKLQDTLRPVVKFVTNFSSRSDGKLNLISSWSETMLHVTVSLGFDPEYEHFEIDYDTPDYLSCGLMNLAELVKHLPTDSLIKCKGCRKSFIDLTKRKKMYCTSSCAARYKSQEKRNDLKDNHPRKYKAYLNKQRERMQKIRKGIPTINERKEV